MIWHNRTKLKHNHSYRIKTTWQNFPIRPYLQLHCHIPRNRNNLFYSNTYTNRWIRQLNNTHYANNTRYSIPTNKQPKILTTTPICQLSNNSITNRQRERNWLNILPTPFSSPLPPRTLRRLNNLFLTCSRNFFNYRIN